MSEAKATNRSEKMTTYELKNIQTTDLGITYQDGDTVERAIIVRGRVEDRDFAGAVLLDKNGKATSPHQPFDVDGVENVGMAAYTLAEEIDGYEGGATASLIENAANEAAEFVA